MLFRLRYRKTKHCEECYGELGDDGRAIAAVENLKVCGKCGDTWPCSIVNRTQEAHEKGRGWISEPLRAQAVTCRLESEREKLSG